jgi:hypothetical protein
MTGGYGLPPSPSATTRIIPPSRSRPQRAGHTLKCNYSSVRARHSAGEHRALSAPDRRADRALPTVAGARPAVLQEPRAATQARRARRAAGSDGHVRGMIRRSRKARRCARHATPHADLPPLALPEWVRPARPAHQGLPFHENPAMAQFLPSALSHDAHSFELRAPIRQTVAEVRSRLETVPRCPRIQDASRPDLARCRAEAGRDIFPKARERRHPSPRLPPRSPRLVPRPRV